MRLLLLQTEGDRREAELYDRLEFLLKELEPWESKLIQANRRMRLKMKKEKNSYTELVVKVCRFSN